MAIPFSNQRLMILKYGAIVFPGKFRYDSNNGPERYEEEATMEIGKQIKQLRLRRGITQEAMAQHLGITAQAVSKWERGAATPDIAMLPELSAYFGVTIDDLFSLSDETRIERIQNMIWDVRYFDPAQVEAEQSFLLEKGKQEPENDKVYELLAELELHQANEHRALAEKYAKEALRRNPESKASHADLVEAMGGRFSDWYVNNHFKLIQYYQTFVEENPQVGRAYLWLIDHLLDAGRVEEAEKYCRRYAGVASSFRPIWCQGNIHLHRGEYQKAEACRLEMITKFPDDWMVFFTMGDIKARCGEYELAKEYYRKGLALQSPPRFCDPYESIAQICELQGNIREAIEVLREELDVQKNEWHVTTGETTDVVRRNIARLEKQQTSAN